MGVTSYEAIYFAEKHIFHHYLPRKYRTNLSSIIKNSQIIQEEQSRGFSYFKKTKYIKNYLKTMYPDHSCHYEEIQEKYMPKTIQQHNITQITQLYSNLLRYLIFI